MNKKKQSQMEEVSISQFKATCMALLARVKRTKKPIVVLHKGEPIAQVVPLLFLPCLNLGSAHFQVPAISWETLSIQAAE